MHCSMFFLKPVINDTRNNTTEISVYLERTRPSFNQAPVISSNEEHHQETPDGNAQNLLAESGKNKGTTKKSGESPTEVVSIKNHSDDHYYRTKEIDETPQVIGRLNIDIFSSIESSKNELLVFDAYINKSGRIESFKIIETNMGKENIQLIFDTFAKTKFTPGYKKGELVNCIKRLEIKTE